MRVLGLCAIVVLLSGCVVVPNSLRPEIEHLSHTSQHEPFTAHETHYGADVVSIMLHWDTPHSYLEVGEGVALDAHRGRGYGEILGPREQFTARFGLIIPLRK